MAQLAVHHLERHTHKHRKRGEHVKDAWKRHSRISWFCHMDPVEAVNPTVAVPSVNLSAYLSESGMLTTAVSMSST